MFCNPSNCKTRGMCLVFYTQYSPNLICSPPRPPFRAFLFLYFFHSPNSIGCKRNRTVKGKSFTLLLSSTHERRWNILVNLMQRTITRFLLTQQKLPMSRKTAVNRFEETQNRTWHELGELEPWRRSHGCLRHANLNCLQCCFCSIQKNKLCIVILPGAERNKCLLFSNCQHVLH